MTSFDYDLLVLGAGSGGVRAGRLAAQGGAKVGIVESSRIGGTCVNRGCVPKKLLVYASHFTEDFHDAVGFGFEPVSPQHDWAKLCAAVEHELTRLNGAYTQTLEKASVDILRGLGKVVGPNAVDIDGTVRTAKWLLVATGGTPTVPSIPGASLGVTSDAMFTLPRRPRRVLVVGAGYIGVEFAGILHGLGSNVILACRRRSPLSGFDGDCRHFLAAELRKKGVDIRVETTVTALREVSDGIEATLEGPSGPAPAVVDLVLFATGRHPRTAGLGLAEVGVKLAGNGAVVVDDFFQTNVPSIYAIGDVISRVQLTPVALAEGAAVVRTLFQGQPSRVDYSNIPSAVFSQPPLGTVGLSEENARAAHADDVVVYATDFRPMKLTLAGRDERTLMKVVVQRSTDRVLGFHMVGPDASEIIQGLAVALQAGVTKRQLDATLGIHPTAAEEFVTLRTPRAS